MTPSRHRSFIAVALPAVLAAILLVPAAASANSVRCRGTVAPQTAKSAELDYVFTCSEEIKGYSVISNMAVTEFSTTADVLDRTSNDPVSGQTFSCEGPIPGDGFGCTGGAQNPNWVAGSFAVEGRRCAGGRNRLRAWLVAIDAADKPSGAFPLRVDKCPRPSKSRKR